MKERGDPKYPSPMYLWVRIAGGMGGKPKVYQVCRGNEGFFGRCEILVEFPESERHLADAMVSMSET